MSDNKENVPMIRFPGFTDPWEQWKVGDLLSEKKRPIKMKDDEEYQLITVKRRNEGIVSRGYFRGKDILVKSYFEIRSGDYLISKRQVVHGANGIVPESLDKSIVSNEYLVSVGNKNITTEYWTLISKRLNMYKQFFLSSYGVDIEKLVFDVEDWKKRTIILPSLAEQKRITLLFQHLDHLINLHQRKLNNIQNLKVGLLQKMFPKDGKDFPEVRFPGFTDAWEQRRLGEITKSYSGGTPSVGKYEYYDGDIPFIRSAEINSDSTELFISETGLNNSSAKMVEVGDILYALYGATSGEVGISRINGAINQAILAIKPEENYDSQFIMQWLRNQKQKIIDKFLQGGQGNLSGSIVKDLQIEVPCYDEQIKLGQLFAELDHLITLHQRKLEHLQKQKKALLQQMFV